MRVALQKLIPYALDKNVALKKAAVTVLVEIYRQYLEEFLCQTRLLPIQQQLDLRRGLVAKLPDLETQLIAAGRPRKEAPIAATELSSRYRSLAARPWTL